MHFLKKVKRTGKKIKDIIEKLIPDFLKRKKNKPDDKPPPKDYKPPKDNPKSETPKCSLPKEPIPPEENAKESEDGESTDDGKPSDQLERLEGFNWYKEVYEKLPEPYRIPPLEEEIHDNNTTDMERILLKEPNNPVFKKRPELSYTINKRLSRQIAETLNRIKGINNHQLGQSGKLNINEYINMKISEKVGEIPNLKVFDEDIETRGLDLTLLVDCSGSMCCIEDKVRDITATVMKALESCPFINFKVLAFSAYTFEYQSVIDVIDKVDDCKRIQADTDDPHDMHNLIIDYAVKDLQDSRNKKMIMMISDGQPYLMYKGEEIDQQTGNNLLERSVMNAKNRGIEMFCLFYNHDTQQIKLMRRIFRGALYESSDFSDIESKLVKELIKSVERLNS